MNELATLAEQFGPEQVWIAFAIFARVGAAAVLLPAFGEQVVSARVKLTIALAFFALIAPIVWSDMTASLQERSETHALLAETVAGLAIGIFFRLMVVVLQITGAVAAQSTSLMQLFGTGLGADPQASFSTLLVVSGLALATSLGFHVQVTQAFIWSYEIFPAGQFPSPADMAEWGVGHVAYVFGFGFALAAPFVLASFIYNLGLGIINKAMPQLMVAFVGAPAISMGGLVVLLFASPLILSFWVEHLIDRTDLGVGGGF